MKTKRTIYIAMIFLLCTTLLFATLFAVQLRKNSTAQKGNYTDDMKIPYAIDFNDGGANAKERCRFCEKSSARGWIALHKLMNDIFRWSYLAITSTRCALFLFIRIGK